MLRWNGDVWLTLEGHIFFYDVIVSPLTRRRLVAGIGGLIYILSWLTARDLFNIFFQVEDKIEIKNFF